MLTKLEVTIHDDKWPQLEIITRRTTVDESTTVTTKPVLYDQAYTQFECSLHNQLRPMVDELIRRRKGV